MREGPPHARRALLVSAVPCGPALFLLALALAGSITRIALGLLLGFERGLPCGFFFLFAGNPGGLGRGGFLGATLFFGLGGFARFFRLGAGGGDGHALGFALLHRRIVGAGLGAKLVEDVFPRFLLRLLAVRKAWFLESAHRWGLVAFSWGRGIGLPFGRFSK